MFFFFSFILYLTSYKPGFMIIYSTYIFYSLFILYIYFFLPQLTHLLYGIPKKLYQLLQKTILCEFPNQKGKKLLVIINLHTSRLEVPEYMKNCCHNKNFPN